MTKTQSLGWVVIDHVHDKQAKLYRLRLGIPVFEMQPILGEGGEALADSRGKSFMRPVFLGWERIETVVFAANAKEYTRHAGRKLGAAKILERHIKAVAQAWGIETKTIDYEMPKEVREAADEWEAAHHDEGK